MSESADSQVCRILVTERRCLKAHFSDGSLILLPFNGEFYVHVNSKGDSSRHLTQTALQRHKKGLFQILQFRNLYFLDSFYTPWLMKMKSETEVSQSQLEWNLVWPTDVAQAIHQNLLSNKGDLIYVHSSDRSHVLVYDPIAARISLRFPLEFRFEDHTTTSFIQNKVVHLWECPSKWHPAMDLAFEYLHSTQSASLCEALSWKEHRPRVLSKVVETSQHNPFKTAWWYCNTSVYPREDMILMEWTPESFYQYFKQQKAVCVWIRMDNSTLFTEQGGKFIRHIRRQPYHKQMYASTAISQSILDSEGKRQYSLKPIAERALLLS